LFASFVLSSNRFVYTIYGNTEFSFYFLDKSTISNYIPLSFTPNIGGNKYKNPSKFISKSSFSKTFYGADWADAGPFVDIL